ncbi:hypothetical protein M5K25_002259 [Dendrobium thyrsiflorum]|uniref:Uncharacterized protein n=1 Tax=Dendrobium thyrsiflorum TaxID=117978 RepID=A0ABD0W3J5_DENTH
MAIVGKDSGGVAADGWLQSAERWRILLIIINPITINPTDLIWPFPVLDWSLNLSLIYHELQHDKHLHEELRSLTYLNYKQGGEALTNSSSGREPLFLPTFRQRQPLPPAENRSTLPSPAENRYLPSPVENRSTLPSPAENRYPFSPLPGEGREPDTSFSNMIRVEDKSATRYRMNSTWFTICKDEEHLSNSHNNVASCVKVTKEVKKEIQTYMNKATMSKHLTQQ